MKSFGSFILAAVIACVSLTPIWAAAAEPSPVLLQFAGNYADRVVTQFTITNAVDTGGTANATNITFVAKNGFGNPVPFALFDVFLSDSTSGMGITATTASGSFGTLASTGTNGTCDAAVAANGAGSYLSGACLGVLTTKKVAHVMANASGSYTLFLLDSAKTLFVPCAAVAGVSVSCGAALTAGSYHS